jgi:hypothetical protein
MEEEQKTTEPIQETKEEYPDITPEMQGESTEPAQQTDEKNSSLDGSGLSPDLVDIAKSGVYGFTDQQIAGFKTDADLEQAFQNFEQQTQFNQQQQMQQQASYYPPQQPLYGNQPQQHEQPPQQQFDVNEVGQNPPKPLLDIDPDSMDEKTYQTLQGLAGQVNQMNQYIQQQQQIMQQQQIEQYYNQMNPLISGLEDPRLDQSNPYGQANVNTFLQEVESMRQQRQMMGLNPSDADLVKAVHRNFSQQAGPVNQMSSQFIGSPNQQRPDPLPPGDERARNAIGRFVSDDPFEELAAENERIRATLLD